MPWWGWVLAFAGCLAVGGAIGYAAARFQVG
jgi:hypothetical protein